MIFIVVIPLALNVFLPDDPSDSGEQNISTEVRVYFHDSGKVKTLDFEQYILGVVCAEMPASFEYEALKAQAVAARTYAVNKMRENSGSKQHKGADVCTDFSHCQAYISQSKACKNWGKNASEYVKKCKNAVGDTVGEILLYNDEPVKAVFHSSSSGKTESAKEVWGGDVPYLVSVDSPGEEKCPSHKSEVIVSEEDFKKKLCSEYDVDFSKSFIGKSTRTSAGAVKEIEVGNIKIKGTAMRSIFNLRSACFDIKTENGNVIFSVTGNGHGVGMSQYGANYLAASGYDYRQILKKYYTGVEFGNISDVK